MNYYEAHLEKCLGDIAIAQEALAQSKLPGTVSDPLLCDVYCIPSHNHQAFYLQIYGGEEYTLLYAKTLITDFYGNRIVMYPFRDAQKADRHAARRGDIYCGMKKLRLDDPTITTLMACLPKEDIDEHPKGWIIDGVTTVIRDFRQGPPRILSYHTTEWLENVPYGEAEKQFLNDLFLHIEDIIGNILDHFRLRRPTDWLLLHQLRERAINNLR